MKPIFSPSILSFNHAHLGEPVRQLMDAEADWIHCDIMDGQFVPPITFGADTVARLKDLGPVPLEAHLMTMSPEKHFEAFVHAGCRRIIFHVEATSHSYRLVQSLQNMGIEAGVALNPGTPVEEAFPVLDLTNLVLIMTVNPGWGGQKFIPACLDKVRRLRAARPDLAIEVDGGIDAQTIVKAKIAGANVFVTGSFLAEAASPAQGLQELRRVCA